MHDDSGRFHLHGHLEQVLVGGIEERVIEIHEADPDWAKRFERERRSLTGALGDEAGLIEHIGSTSVPGLAAKPVIDILVSVEDPDDETRYTGPLQHAGYVLRVRESGHLMFRTPERDVHVHLWRAGSADVRRHMLFRDWLRRCSADCDVYEKTKRELASRRWPDMNYYAEAKSGVISRIMERAESWAEDSRWRAT